MLLSSGRCLSCVERLEIKLSGIVFAGLVVWQARGQGRGNLKQLGIYLFWLVKKCLVNLLGIPVGTLRGLDSGGRCCWSYAP